MLCFILTLVLSVWTFQLVLILWCACISYQTDTRLHICGISFSSRFFTFILCLLYIFLMLSCIFSLYGELSISWSFVWIPGMFREPLVHEYDKLQRCLAILFVAFDKICYWYNVFKWVIFSFGLFIVNLLHDWTLPLLKRIKNAKSEGNFLLGKNYLPKMHSFHSQNSEKPLPADD